MQRRNFLKLLGLMPMAWWSRGAFASDLPGGRRTLLLVELSGGNDGLNTVVPFRDADYFALRPRLALDPDDLLPLSDELALHPSLRPLADLYEAGELAVALGVGYPDPNRSHFRSVAIWEAGSHSHQVLNDGWVTRTLVGHLVDGDAPDALVLGDGDFGPLAGERLRSLVIDSETDFFELARQLDELAPTGSNPALDHWLRVQNDVAVGARTLERHLTRRARLAARFPRNALGVQLELAARLLVAGLSIPAIKVTQGGYDTHANQRRVHGNLLQGLAEGLAAFREALREAGRWDDVLVLTYSEFGRRAGENASNGTDHGTAAPHFLLGGRVLGGQYGAQPSLNDLDSGDLRHTLDYRRLYSTVAQRWWGLPAPVDETIFPPIDCLTA